ncbi:phage tail protein [Pseudobutyrivibrio sp. MD2005]|uniref:phage tail protein n=1 Tax=Pseudobutyrivibrio sp. MD2005 TaxID=1410616 RepID=UPI00048682F3|nr:phage tail protein [Pseudobutyrivibrio sp. MD2005]
MAYLRNYSFRKSRLEKAAIYGITLDGETIKIDKDCYEHGVFFSALDSGDTEMPWGRLSMKIEKSEEVLFKVHVFATDNKYMSEQTTWNEFLLDSSIPLNEKAKVFISVENKAYIATSDAILFDVVGRYCFIYLEILGTEDCSISQIRMFLPGDNFFQTLPEIYQQNNEFLKKYLSIFSTIYNDFQEQLEAAPKLLDIDTTPVELLPVFASWMGVNVEGSFLSDDQLRTLVKSLYSLNRMKGTRAALEKLCEIVLEEKPIIVEQAMMDNLDADKNIYGNSPFDIIMFVENFVPEDKRMQIMYLLKQFIPVRANLNIVYLEKKSSMDGYTYLDMNAQMYDEKNGSLDEKKRLDGHIIIQ